MTQAQDPRAVLAQMKAEEDAAKKKVEELAAANEKKRGELLAKLRDEDLADVRAKCTMHGFTATDLRGCLKTRGGGKGAARKSSTRAPAKKRASKKAKA